MKPLTPSEHEEQLTQALRAWGVDVPMPARFQEQVWRRISQAETKAAGSGWAGAIGLLAESLARPKVAYAYVAVLIAFGIAAGAWTAQVERTRLETTLSERYVHSLDPYQFAVTSR
ncbi:MAG: hypothetical protein EHM39_11080 [Chloroflexi bacterium]|nr:MAG: hypothetical protein EHM39_11080 [Chloroflexota bacterium]